MTCAEHGEVVMDLARGLPVDQQRLAAAGRHAAECPRCTADEREQRSAQRALRALAEASGSLSAPVRVETALLAAFRARPGASPDHRAARRPWEWNTGLLAVAATLVIVVGAALVARLAPTPTGAPDPPAAPAGSVSMAPPLSVPPPSSGEMGLVARAPRAHDVVPGGAGAGLVRREAARPRTTASSATARVASDPAAAGFFSLPWTGGTMPGDTAQLVRIKVPRASLAALGLSVGGDDLSRTVDAEVLVGDDGLAHAIRVVGEAGAL